MSNSKLTDEQLKMVTAAGRQVTRKVKSNFGAYHDYADHLDKKKAPLFCGSSYSDKVVSHQDGVTALQAFSAVDSLGINPPCREPEVLLKVWKAKAALNFQIKQWAQGISEGLFCMDEFKQEYKFLPDWVWNAVAGQVSNWNGFKWYHQDKF